MQHKTLGSFLVRWAGCALGLWIAQAILGYDKLYLGGKLSTVLIAGLILALINVLLRPILVFLALPAIMLTLGLFMFIVNGLSILIASWLYDPFVVSGLLAAVVAAIIVGIVNFLVSIVFKDLAQGGHHNKSQNGKVIDV